MARVCNDTEPHVAAATANEEIRSDSWLYKASLSLVRMLESRCGYWGRLVATHPFLTTLVCIALVVVSSIGLISIQAELRPYKLWIPQDSEVIKVTNWQTDNFPRDYRRHVILWEAVDGNVLTAAAIKEMWQMHQLVEELTTTADDQIVNWADVCVTVPSILDPAGTDDYTYEDYDDNYDRYGDYNDSHGYVDYSLDFATLGPDYYDFEAERSRVSLDFWAQGVEYEDLTTETPVTKPLLSEAIKRMYESVSNEIIEGVQEDNSLHMSRSDYCSAISALHPTCLENSILEVFGYDDELIMNLTDEQVVDAINNAYVSQIYGYPTKFTKYLGGIKRDKNGTIISATVAIHSWTTQINKGLLINNINVTIDPGNGEIVDNKGFAWEEAFVEHILRSDLKVLTPHVNAAHSHGSVSVSLIHGNIKYVAAGWCLLVLYVLFTLGRTGSAVVGLLCIGMAVLASYGICAAIGLPYGPINAVIPVLLIGLGVDDMFVIAAAWEALPGLPLQERAFKTMSHAGVAITVTSVTDIVAFIVGATTQVPALRWFCINAAVGVTFVYVLQATVFVAGLVIDQRLKNKGKICFLDKREVDEDKKKTNILNQAMNKYADLLSNNIYRISILILTILILIWGLWGTASLQQKFDPIWFLPQSSYLYKWFGAMDTHFPSSGERGFIYFSYISLPEELPGLRQLYFSLKEIPHVSNVDAWFSVFDIFVNEHPVYQGKNMTSDLFYDALGLFIHSSSGAIFRNHFVFNTNISCEGSAPPFSAFKIEFQYDQLTEKSEQQAAMIELREVVAAANISGYHAAWAKVYIEWEIDALLTGELWRNMSLVTTVVAAMTLILLASARAAILVIVCVLATLVDVAAIMHSWGLTVDTVTCIAFVLAIGMCVDYAAHVAHAFLVARGDKKARARTAVSDVGPAVLHGGVSTILAFVVLAFSDSYIFLSFCKIFTGVSAFGLFHGLVVLPVMLSYVGPEPYPLDHDKQDDIRVVYTVKVSPKNIEPSDSEIVIYNASTLTVFSTGKEKEDSCIVIESHIQSHIYRVRNIGYPQEHLGIKIQCGSWHP